MLLLPSISLGVTASWELDALIAVKLHHLIGFCAQAKRVKLGN